MLKKILILLFILLALAIAGYYVLDAQGAFQTKEDIYGQKNATAPEMKCETGKCGAEKCAANIDKK